MKTYIIEMKYTLSHETLLELLDLSTDITNPNQEQIDKALKVIAHAYQEYPLDKDVVDLTKDDSLVEDLTEAFEEEEE